MPLKILELSSEIAPYAKTGGLADVLRALPPALKRKGAEIRMAMPKYKSVAEGNFNLTSTGIVADERLGANQISGLWLESRLHTDIPVYFLEHNDFYHRVKLYQELDADYHDNLERFTFFNKAVLSLLKQLQWKPDIIHCHDWQMGLIPAYLKTNLMLDDFYKDIKTVFTLHNLGHQGLFSRDRFYLLGLPEEAFSMHGLEFWGQISLLKAGFMYADALTTVSMQYAKEIQTGAKGQGFDGVLRYRSDDLHGILNGADYETWNPKTDPYIAENFDETNLKGKVACRKDLLNTFQLPYKIDDGPILGMVTRLVDHKGIDMVLETIQEIIDMGCLFILLGNGEKRYELALDGLNAKFPGRVGVEIGFDSKLAHKIYAGADMFLMPSKDEPCGLSQMYSMKYGTIPVVSANGGLENTVSNFFQPWFTGNGYKFKNYTPEDFVKVLKRAVKVFNNNVKRWNQLIQNAMASNFSWDVSAESYMQLFEKLTMVEPDDM